MNVARIEKLAEWIYAVDADQWSTDYCVEKVGDEGHGLKCDGAGWLPAVFPELVEWRGCEDRNVLGGVVFVGDGPGVVRHGYEVAASVLGIPVDDAATLFLPRDPARMPAWAPVDETPEALSDALLEYARARVHRETKEAPTVATGAAVVVLVVALVAKADLGLCVLCAAAAGFAAWVTWRKT